MHRKIGLLALMFLLVPAFPLATSVGHARSIHLPTVTTVWPAGTTGDLSKTDLAPLLPSVAPHAFASTSTTYSGYYYVGADSEVASVYSNYGVGATIQVISTQASGCLSYWVADDSSASIWGQVGYYLCNSSTPVAFYQIWNLNTNTVLVTGTASVTTGAHQFSMYSQSGSTWAFTLDGGILGTYNMGSSVSSSSYPVEALSEEGSVSAPWNPPQVQFSQIQVRSSAGAWSSVSTGFVPYGCNSSSYSCWGDAGNMQNPSISTDSVLVGGSTSTILSGTVLWNGVTTTTTTSSTTTTSTKSSTSTTSSTTKSSTSTTSTTTTAASTTAALKAQLTISPSTNTRKSTEYFTVHVTNQNGVAVAGASVTLVVTAPNAKPSTVVASTDSSGNVNFQYKLNAVALLGTYSVSATATAPGYLSGTVTGTFQVN